MIGVPVRWLKGGDFLVRSLTQILGQDIPHSAMAIEENNVVSGMDLRFSRRLNGHNFGLSAVEWSPFRPVRSRRVQLRFGLQNSSVFSRKKRASSYPYPHGEILHTFGRKRVQNIEDQGGLCGTEPGCCAPPDQCLDARDLAPACNSSQPK